MGENNVHEYMPKNIRQIGHSHTNDKIYIEDYVMTYIKQIHNTLGDKDRILVLVGYRETIGELKYTFVSGVVELKDGIETYTDLLLNKNITEITRIKEDFYGEKDIVGLGIVSNNEWLKFSSDIHNYFASKLMGDVVLIRDALKDEQVYRYRDKSFNKLKGYYVYYERNEAMQNYMLCVKDGKSIESGYIATELIDKKLDEKIRTYTIPKNAVYSNKSVPYTKYKTVIEENWNSRVKYILASVLIIVILLAGVARVDKLEEVTKQRADGLVEKSKEVLSDKSKELEVETIEGEVKILDSPVPSASNAPTSSVPSNMDSSNENKKQEENEVEVKEKAVPSSATVTSKTKENIKAKINYYVVKKGDALVDISRRIYGTHKRVEDIKKANGIVDENKIFIGQRLVMP